MTGEYNVASTAARRLLDGSHGFLFAGLTRSPPAKGGLPRLDLGVGLRSEVFDAKASIVEVLVGRFLLDLTGGREPLHTELTNTVDNGIKTLEKQELEMITNVDTSFGGGIDTDMHSLASKEQLGHLSKKREMTKQWFEQDRERLGFRVGTVTSEDTHAQIETLLGRPLDHPPWNTSGSDSPPVGSIPQLELGYDENEFTPTVASIDWISTTAPDREPLEIELPLIGVWVLIAASMVDEEPSAFLHKVAGHIGVE